MEIYSRHWMESLRVSVMSGVPSELSECGEMFECGVCQQDCEGAKGT